MVKKSGLTLRNNRGFTLIELIVVIAIMAIAMTIAVPSLTSITNRQNENRYKQNCLAAAEVVEPLINMVNSGYVTYQFEKTTYQLKVLSSFNSLTTAVNYNAAFNIVVTGASSYPGTSTYAKDTVIIYVVNISNTVTPPKTRIIRGMWFYDLSNKSIVYRYDYQLVTGYTGTNAKKAFT